MIERISRVVTGHDDHGSAVFTETGAIEPVEVLFQPGIRFWPIWGTSSDGPVIGRDDPAEFAPFFPAGTGTRVTLVRFAPQNEVAATPAANYTREELRRDAEAKFPGMFAAHDDGTEEVATHTTQTVDYGFLLEGELYLELDGGREVRLRPGDCVVQRGTRHTWKNRSDEPALAAFVLIGARRAEADRREADG